MAAPSERVVIVGGGVVGLTTALACVRAGHRTVVFDAGELEHNCSSNSGAVWGPFLSEKQSRSGSWSRRTLKVLTELSTVAGSGVSVVNGIGIDDEPSQEPWWVDSHPGSRPLAGAADRLEWRFDVPIIDMPVYLRFLEDQFRAEGGTLVREGVDRLDGLSGEGGHLVVAAGSQSPGLIGETSDLVPVRGQLLVVANPGIDQFVSVRGDGPELTYILPQGDKVVLGGTAEWNETSLEVDQEAAERILRRCAVYEPRLLETEVLGHRVGIRPYRHTVRVEHARTGHVIYNYGHGGSGVSVSWGCARDVAKLIEACDGV